MNHLKRAWLSVMRRKGKTLILLVVIFILGNIIAGAFSISQASGRVEKNIKEKLGAIATPTLDWEAVDLAAKEAEKNGTEFLYDFDSIPLDKLKEVASLPQVKTFDYALDYYLETDVYKQVMGDGMEIMPREGEVQMSFFTVSGVSRPDFELLSSEKLVLTSGAVFTQADVDAANDVVLVSEKFAAANGVAVGDILDFKMQAIEYSDQGEELSRDSIPYNLKIVGVFKPMMFEGKEDEEGNQSWMENMYDNTFYVTTPSIFNAALAHAELEYSMNPYLYNEYDPKTNLEQRIVASYILNSPEDIASFAVDAAPYLPQFYKLDISSDRYEQIAAPITSLDKLSKITLYVAVGASVMILSLVIVLFLRDRKHELGIYLSLGDKRNKVVSQIVMEVLMIAFLAFTLSIFSGNMIAKSLSKSLVNVEKFQDDGMHFVGMISSSSSYYDPNESVSPTDVVEAYSVELTASYIIGFYGIGLLVVVLSTLVPTMYITRLNPKKIMM
ncbi:MAG: ABC transporter permease [Erysipelothrix sp.]|nr:ABC transporter permease [Erysipelothrix sp.]